MRALLPVQATHRRLALSSFLSGATHELRLQLSRPALRRTCPRKRRSSASRLRSATATTVVEAVEEAQVRVKVWVEDKAAHVLHVKVRVEDDTPPVARRFRDGKLVLRVAADDPLGVKNSAPRMIGGVRVGAAADDKLAVNGGNNRRKR